MDHPRRRHVALAVCFWFAGTIGACGSTVVPDDGGGSPGDDTGSAADADALPPPMGILELGTGVEAFEPITDGSTIGLTRGFQGLQHVWVSLRVREMDTDRAITELTLTREQDDVVVSDSFRVRIPFEVHGGYAELLGIQLVTPDENAVLDEAVILSARVENRDGASAEADARFSVVWEDDLIGER